jgi:hypothetical protein
LRRRANVGMYVMTHTRFDAAHDPDPPAKYQ